MMNKPPKENAVRTLEDFPRKTLNICYRCKDKVFEYIHILKDEKEQSRTFSILCPPCIVNTINPYETNNLIFASIFLEKNKRSNKMTKSSREFHIDFSFIKTLKSDTSMGIFLYCLESSKIVNSINKFKWPINFSILLNGTKLSIENRVDMDITNSIQENNTLEINYTYIPNNISVMIVQRTSRNLCDIPLSNNLSIDDCFIKTLKNFGEQMISKEKFSLNCVYTNKLISTPVKGLDCKHFQCFDYLTFLKINKIRRKFECPICKNLCFKDDLYEEKHFREILDTCKSSFGLEDLEDLEFYLDSKGKWSWNQKQKENKNIIDSFDETNQKCIENLNFSPKNYQDKELSSKLSQVSKSKSTSIHTGKNSEDDCDIHVVIDSESQDDSPRLLKSIFEKCNQRNPIDLCKELYREISKSIHKIKNIEFKSVSSLMRQYRIFPDKKCVNLNKISDPTNINPKYISILCSEFYYKHQSFIDLLFLIFHDIQDLVCIIASNSNYNSISMTKTDSYLTLELLLGCAFNLSERNQYNIEFSLGILTAIHCRILKLNEVVTYKFLCLLLDCLPSFQLIHGNLKKKDSKFEILINFYSGFLGVFPTEFAGELCKVLFTDINVAIKNMSSPSLIFLNEVETKFLFPMMNKVYRDIQNVAEFIRNWDESGNFRIYLTSVNKLENYGFQLIQQETCKKRKRNKRLGLEIFEELN